jgi:hypothetical protein
MPATVSHAHLGSTGVPPPQLTAEITGEALSNRFVIASAGDTPISREHAFPEVYLQVPEQADQMRSTLITLNTNLAHLGDVLAPVAVHDTSVAWSDGILV